MEEDTVMDTNWIENAFEKAELESGLSPEKRMFLDRLPALVLSFLLTYGPAATKGVVDAVKADEYLARFVAFVFACGIIEGKNDHKDKP